MKIAATTGHGPRKKRRSWWHRLCFDGEQVREDETKKNEEAHA